MERLREFIQRRRALVPYDYPLAVAVPYCGTIFAAACAAIQRGLTQPWLLLAACLLVVAPVLIFVAGGHKLGSLATATCVLCSVALLLTWPPVLTDAAPLLLMFLAGEIAAVGSWHAGILVTGASAALLAGASLTHHLNTPLPYLITLVVIGWMMGRILQLQQRLLLQARTQQSRRAEQAATAERQRIAREIHDVIAHSLSVTLLHLTGARRALQEDRDVEDAVSGLLDAERLGREAMSDIRNTVGLLSAGATTGKPTVSAPAPGIDDIPALITDFTAAGLAVESEVDAANSAISAGVGLTLYRVAQESLANIAKHAPSSKAQLRLHVTESAVHLSTCNDLHGVRQLLASTGAGLSGMQQRVEALGGDFHAGPGHTGWTVLAHIPLQVEAVSSRSETKVGAEQ